MNALIAQIRRGDFDDQLDVIAEAVHERRKLRRQLAALDVRAQIGTGSKVRLVATTKPAFLAGRTATVNSVRSTRATITLDRAPINDLRFAGEFTCPLNLLEVLLG